MQPDTKPTNDQKESEIDLGVFLNLVGKLFSSIATAVGSFFSFLFQLILSIFIFIKRKIAWLVAGLLAGLSLGLYFYFKEGPVYYSDVVVRSGLGSSRPLYNTIDYFNALIGDDRIKELTDVFDITETDSRKLIGFEISPIDDELETVKLYKDFISDYNRNNPINDTQRIVINYADFRNNLTGVNYPLQRIRVYSHSPEIYRSIQTGLVKNLEQNKDLITLQDKFRNVLKEEEALLSRSLIGLDSLRIAYNKSIAQGNAKGEGGNVVMGSNNKNFSNPEIELYDKEMQLKDAITGIRNKLIEQQSTFRITSDINKRGVKVSGYNQRFFRYGWVGLLISFFLVLLIECYRFLDKMDKKQSPKYPEPDK
ncbi:hypothetical protein [Agriterribacter sp.]|uniref:hypothetical protein n=1 Tax=Agriterribacter sp. TaxID=2821509 RepID=UPI002B8233DF|nr:hypothetical protein [Agriterribacter sp.]HTN08899.1 hypothetical protein [Agriterribacter sp.]